MQIDIEKVKALAIEAGHAILEIYKQADLSVSSKLDSSPLTQADLAAHEIIVEGLRKLTNETIVSEEDKIQQSEVGSTFWLIDPLDGTRDFVARKDTFAVCIARLEHHHPVLGVIYAPVTKEIWWAEKDRGAFSGGRGDEKIRLFNKREGENDLIAAGSRSMPSDRMNMFYENFSITEIVRLGSAMKFCKVAEGQFDLYPRFGATSEWDTAAAQIILEESGCKLIDIATQKPVTYGKPGFLNRGFVASRANLDIVGQLHARGLIPAHAKKI